MAKFNRTQKFTKSNVKKVSNDTAIVYKIKSPAGENLYTGTAKKGRGQERLLEHKELKKEMIPGGTRFQVAQVKTKEVGIKIERQIIKKEQPKFNEQDKV